MEMRRKDKALSDEVAKEILRDCEYGILCFATKDGGYGIPMVYAYEDDKIWMHGSAVGRKNDAIKFDNRVCFTVVDDKEMDTGTYITKHRSVTAFGRIHQTNDEHRIEGLNAIRKKRGLEPKPEANDNKKHRVAVFYIDIEYITAKGRKKY